MREVLSYLPVARAAKKAVAQRWVPVTEDEINAIAPEVDAAYERAIGLDKWHDDSIHQMLVSQMPSVEVRRRVAKHHLELLKANEYVGWIDSNTWWHVIGPALDYEPPRAVRLRGAHRIPKLWERLLTPLTKGVEPCSIRLLTQ